MAIVVLPLSQGGMRAGHILDPHGRAVAAVGLGGAMLGFAARPHLGNTIVYAHLLASHP